MSTRGLTGFRCSGKLYAMYNHFDSYPEGLGQDVVEFCKMVPDWGSDVILKRISNIKLVDENGTPSPKKIKKYSRFHSNPNEGLHGRIEDETWYWLLHSLQGVGILAGIVTGKVKHMIDDADFLDDEISCQWAYIINIDEQTLEVWHKAKMLYAYNLAELPDFMLGITNEFKRNYDRITSASILSNELSELRINPLTK